jgi:putative transposase
VERFSLSTIDRDLLDWERWPQVDELSIKNERRREQFVCRSRVVKLLIQEIPRSEILAQTGISGKRAVHWFRRCLTLHPDGRVYGFRALIPMSRVEPYHRHAEVRFALGHSRAGAAGAFTQLLRSYPELETLLQKQILKLSKGKRIYETRIPLKSLHKLFLDRSILLRQRGGASCRMKLWRTSAAACCGRCSPSASS